MVLKQNLGESYDSVTSLEKKVECGVLKQVQSAGGYCLPQFITKNKSVFFAVDYIDEDTCDGQDTLHGTVVVMNKKDFEDCEPGMKPVTIPDTGYTCTTQ